jgi:DNA-binding GntR family transcriptional regulator
MQGVETILVTTNIDDRPESDEKRSARVAMETVVRRLEEEIVLGRLRPRERLLEEDLAREFDTKRHVVRAALAELESMGIVVRQPNRGATVRDFTALEVEQIYDLRQVLERYAAQIMPLPADPALLGRLRGLHARHSRAVDAGDSRTVFRTNLEFHRVFFGACGNPYVAEQIGQLASRAHAIRFLAITDDALLDRARREHGQMIEFLETGQRERLVELVGEHIKPSKEAYLKLASRWARSEQGR